MRGSHRPRRPPKAAGEVIYPERDGKPLGETEAHVMVLVDLLFTLRHHFRRRPDVYVIGGIFLYYEEGNPQARTSPDMMVIKGVRPGGERGSFKTWQEGAAPCVVIEATSPETADEDWGAKRETCRRLGVREYFLFDPLRDYLERPLMGYRLVGREYEPLPLAEDGGLLSTEMGLRLVPRGSQLGLFYPESGERLPTAAEAYVLLEEAKQGAEAERRASLAEQQLQQERQRVEQLAQELARLRALLPPGQGGTGPAQP